MNSKKIIVALKQGLHARPASLLVQMSREYEAKITLTANGQKADAKSILQVLSLAVGSGSELLIEVEGSDEAELLQAVVDFLTAAE